MIFNKKTIEDVDVKGKRVLVRCDFNIPLKEGKITDKNRLVGSLPTIKYLMGKKAKVILCSHLGKPKGQVRPELSLRPVARELSQLLKKEVVFAADDNVVGENAKSAVENMKVGDVVLLENTRYRVEETKNEDSFSKELASLAEIYVDDAFGTAHRTHCSTVGVTKFLPTAVCGYLIQKELNFLGNIIENPARPFTAILGGVKVSDKINVINNLLEKVDTLMIGGGMSYTFMRAQGYTTGISIVEEDKIGYAKEMIDKAKSKGVKLLLPVDGIIADKFDQNAEPLLEDSKNIKDGYMGMDIGPKTAKLYIDVINNSKTVFWNGPMGVFEFKNFAKGTFEIAKAMAESDAITIIGGGDSAAAINQMGFGDKITHISTGGGASLEFLGGEELPGISVLDNK